MKQALYITGGTQQLYGIWSDKLQAWVRDAGGSVALHGKEQGEALVNFDRSLVIKEVFICCNEELVDIRLPARQQRWRELDLLRKEQLG